jgi:hypothetical protein
MSDFMQLQPEVRIMDFLLADGLKDGLIVEDLNFKNFILGWKSNIKFKVEKRAKNNKEIILCYNPDDFLGRKYSYFSNDLFENKEVSFKRNKHRGNVSKTIYVSVDSLGFCAKFKNKSQKDFLQIKTSSDKINKVSAFIKSLQGRIISFLEGGFLVDNSSIHITEVIFCLDENKINYKFNGVDLVII